MHAVIIKLMNYVDLKGLRSDVTRHQVVWG